MTVVEPLAKRDLPLSARLIVTGATWEVSTNHQGLLAIMEKEFEFKGDDGFAPDLKLCFYVDSELPGRGRQFRPYFRALEHLYYGTFGPCDSMLVDQRNRRVVAKMSLPTACDASYWKRVILPCLVGITSACVGVTPVHCACVVKSYMGLLIHGESGSGKSTLALSLSLNGFSYLADDCTYVSDTKGGLRCWGLPAPLKLLPNAVAYFPQLGGITPSESLNGELAFEVDPAEVFGVLRQPSCEPHWLVFIERNQEAASEFRTISSAEAARRLADELEVLPPCIAAQRDHQLEVIDRLVQRECRVLRHGLEPDRLATVLAEFCSR